MGVVTVTERQAFKRCRVRWDYTSHSRQNLEPILTPTAFTLGSLVHKTLEEWTLNPESDPVELLKAAALVELERTRERYLEAVGTPISDEELGGFWDSVDLSLKMVENYKSQHGSPIPKGFTIVGLEQTFLIPVPNSKCAKCYDYHFQVLDYDHEYEPHYLEATLDFVMRGPDGRYWVGERKTYRARPKIETLDTADQFLAYCWVLQQAGLTPVGGVAYDGLWKRDVLTPSGRASSRVELKDLFTRLLLTRPQYEIDRFGEYLTHEVNEMCDPDTPLYLNRRWEGCGDCHMEKLCTAQHKGEDVEYIRQTFYTQRDTNALRTALRDDDDS